jgi:ubiquinone/menaquinone biosynthesis C-methylase UbiE
MGTAYRRHAARPAGSNARPADTLGGMDDWRRYDDVADTYERIHAPRVAEVARDLVEMAGVGTGARVLDVGTGTGVAAAAAADAVGPEGLSVGIDVSMGMLVVARRARPGLHLAAASAIDLPFRDRTFDSAVANFVVSHFRKYETALFDMLRVLRQGGRLAMSSWADKPDDLQKTWAELVESSVGPGLLADARRQAVPWADRFTERTAIEETLIDAGLRRVRTERREYRFVYPLEDYVEGLGAWSSGRFVRSMLGEEGWGRFLERAHETFAERFADPVNDFREVWLAVGAKPEY